MKWPLTDRGELPGAWAGHDAHGRAKHCSRARAVSVAGARVGRSRSCAFLISDRAAGITGKFVAAQYDGWRDWPERLEELNDSDHLHAPPDRSARPRIGLAIVLAALASLGIFTACALIGLALVSLLAREDRPYLPLLAPVLGAAALGIPTVWLNVSGHPIGSFGPWLVGAGFLAAAVTLFYEPQS